MTMEHSNLTPFVVKYDTYSKELSFYTKKNIRKLSDLKDFFYDRNAVVAILKKGDNPEIYSYYDIQRPKNLGEFNLGGTRINPGMMKIKLKINV